MCVLTRKATICLLLYYFCSFSEDVRLLKNDIVCIHCGPFRNYERKNDFTRFNPFIIYTYLARRRATLRVIATLYCTTHALKRRLRSYLFFIFPNETRLKTNYTMTNDLSHGWAIIALNFSK